MSTDQHPLYRAMKANPTGVIAATRELINASLNPCVESTPTEQYSDKLWIKREDLSCPGGPNFSKMRGVFKHVAKQNTHDIGVLDTFHSQAGHAVARAGVLLGKKVWNFYPEYKRAPGPREPQLRAEALGAQLVGLPAGMSAVLWHKANRYVSEFNGYMMPNGLQLVESIEETKLEVLRTVLPEGLEAVVIAASSGTIAQGVVEGFLARPEATFEPLPAFIVHMGYSRSHEKMHARFSVPVTLVDEGYKYADAARPGPPPPCPMNEFYDRKMWVWYTQSHLVYYRTLLWNIG